MTGKSRAAAFLLASITAWWEPSAASPLPYPELRTFEKALLTTAEHDFGGRAAAFEAALRWDGGRLRDSQGEVGAPHLACAEYGRGRETYSRLRSFLSPEAVRLAAHSEGHGACYFATASHAQATAILEDEEQFGLKSFSPFPSALKIAPGLLDHGGRIAADGEDGSTGPAVRLDARHGRSMRMTNVNGLNVELSPGTLPARSLEAKSFINALLGDLMSESIDLHSTNFWSDPAMVEGEHLATPEGALRAENWGRAATVVHELSEAAGTTPGDICSWDSVVAYHAGDDLLLVSGLEHLLFSGRGAGGSTEEESAELHMACFMGLVSFLAGRPDVLRIMPRHSKRVLNGAARAVIQSATETDTPLTDAGLDGTGEVIQIIDTGLDETSCFFIDDDGEEVQHGYYFDELSAAVVTASSVTDPFNIFTGGDYTYVSDRRKIIQYIDMVNQDSEYSSYSTINGYVFPLLTADGFGEDEEAGHGTHVAGSAAGATLNTPAETLTCTVGELGCAGACIDGTDDDLVTADAQYSVSLLGSDLDRLCPMFGCDDATDPCLTDDVSETLTENGGMAQGAKLSIFDVFFEDFALIDHVGTDLFEPCEEAGCRIHSSSLGGDTECTLTSLEILYDDYMYQNPEHLLLFAAGNDGDEVRTTCTINSPALSKNSLAVGASTSGASRLVVTDGDTDIDTVSYLSSYGFTTDGRIKPEVLAPGDMIYSAASDGTETHSCRVWAYHGTSMSCPIVAGASAMVRQYFTDESFYAADVTARGFCSDGFICEGFSPSSATVKALLINSANLMGGTSEPDGSRGFGRIHLEEGMPLSGEGSLALFVADAADTSISEFSLQEYLFDVDAEAGLEFRATLSWIDPAASSSSTVQLVHDLDLAVVAPDGVTTYRMWGEDLVDVVNVNERVIVDAADVETGTWTVWVYAKGLTTDAQSYSLVVNGAISPGTGEGASAGSSFDTSNPLEDSAGASSTATPMTILSLALAVLATAVTAGGRLSW